MRLRHYTFKNLMAFNAAGFFGVAFVVFLTSSQPFYLSEIISSDKIGSKIGTLGIVDELVSIVTAPLLGSLCDRVSNYAYSHAEKSVVSGCKMVVVAGFVVVGISLYCYGKVVLNFTQLLAVRALFALGITACMCMITVMLNEVSNSDFSWKRLRFWQSRDETRPLLPGGSAASTPASTPVTSPVPPPSSTFLPIGADAIPADAITSPSSHTQHSHTQHPSHLHHTHQRKLNGKYASLVGVATGLGAVFSVSFFLPLPVKLNDQYPDLSSKTSLLLSYQIIGGISVVVAVVMAFFLYNSVSANRRRAVRHPVRQVSYWHLLVSAVKTSRNNRPLQVSYIGAFVARSTTVTTSVFIPLLVYNFYYHSGLCGAKDKENCYDGYIFAAILTGVAQTVALFLAPLWGILIDHKSMGHMRTLFAASVVGCVGALGLCLVGSDSDVYDPRTALCFVLVSLVGLAQIGVIISSMSLLSITEKTALEGGDIGSLSGLYSLCGGIGILIISKAGGSWSDSWILGPFLLLGLFYSILMVTSAFQLKRA